MQKLHGISGLAISLAISSMALAASEMSPQEFVTKASEAGMAEVELSKLALQKSNDADIKTFAQQMVTDHGKLGAELKAMADRKKLIPSGKLTDSQLEVVEKLKNKTGKDFDDAYSDRMEEDHEESVKLFTDAAKSSDSELAAFAAKTLPTLKAHEKMAEHLDATH